MYRYRNIKSIYIYSHFFLFRFTYSCIFFISIVTVEELLLFVLVDFSFFAYSNYFDGFYIRKEVFFTLLWGLSA